MGCQIENVYVWNNAVYSYDSLIRTKPRTNLLGHVDQIATCWTREGIGTYLRSRARAYYETDERDGFGVRGLFLVSIQISQPNTIIGYQDECTRVLYLEGFKGS